MQIEVYFDDNPSPIQVLTPPEKFKLDTTRIKDGKHKLTFKAINDNGKESVRIIPFQIQNGPAITIHGIRNNDHLSGEISILANAYSASIGDEFELTCMETPAPIPTWAWILFLAILAWGAGYISLEVNNRNTQDTAIISKSSNQSSSIEGKEASWIALGAQIYGNNCSSCHQADGSGLPGVFPPLKNNAVVQSDNTTEHIRTVLEGVSGKVIDGIKYTSPMPGFGTQLDDEQVAAVVNHERTQWGNNGLRVTKEDVVKLRHAKKTR